MALTRGLVGWCGGYVDFAASPRGGPQRRLRIPCRRMTEPVVISRFLAVCSIPTFLAAKPLAAVQWH